MIPPLFDGDVNFLYSEHDFRATFNFSLVTLSTPLAAKILKYFFKGTDQLLINLTIN